VALNGLGKDATICANEYGVTMIMSITSFSNKAALTADPLIDEGLTEFTAVDLVVCQSKTAREAVEVLCGLLDTYGSSEVNIALIADQKEAWYVEMYNGHQYAAVKLPDDKVSVFGNEFSLEYVSDYADAILSPKLEESAKDFAVYDKDGRLNLLATYSGQEVVTDYSHMRTWIGHQLLAPSVYSGAYDKTALYPLCFTPDKKVSLTDVMEIIRNRFDGTEYSPDATKRTDMRVIGTETALSVHIAQIYPDLEADLCCVTWESTGPAIYGVFVPVSNAVTRISEPYGRNQSADQVGVFDTNLYPYYRFKELTTLCTEKAYLQSVRGYWHEAEAVMADSMAKILSSLPEDKAEAARILTDYCCAAQETAFEDAGTLLNEVRRYNSKNSNSMKNGRNPETHEVLDELKAIPALAINLDASKYTASAAALTRAEIAAELYRAEGEPAVSGKAAFTDTAADAWYAPAVEWASENGIVLGYGDGRFGPDDPVTREQLAAILYRWAQCKGREIKPVALDTKDAAEVSAWAVESVGWAAANGLLTTDGGKIRPGAPASGSGLPEAVRVFLKAE
ncbi:MAG: C69 family dipeptidase, partial [Clostridia bacterium]|nr:C69 family dipeptidase [Clostridia bacterium]